MTFSFYYYPSPTLAIFLLGLFGDIYAPTNVCGKDIGL